MAGDSSLQVISFKMIAYKICNPGDDVFEADNNGNVFIPSVKSILTKVCSGSILEFTCIKAINKSGHILTLQPFSLTIK